MYGFFQGLPAFKHSRQVDFGRQNTVAYAPGHAKNEKSCSRSLFASEMFGIVQADIPVAVFALACQQSFGHSLEIFQILIPVFFVGGSDFHIPGQGRVHPAVAPGPITVFPVGLGIGRTEIGISPPKPLFGIVQTLRAVTVASEHIHLVCFFVVTLIAGELPQLRKDRHGHLYGIYPGPVVVLRGVDQHVHRDFDVFYQGGIGANIV